MDLDPIVLDAVQKTPGPVLIFTAASNVLEDGYSEIWSLTRLTRE